MKSVSILPALKWMFASSVVKIMLNSTVLIWHNSLSISFPNQSKMCYHSMIDFVLLLMFLNRDWWFGYLMFKKCSEFSCPKIGQKPATERNDLEVTITFFLIL